MVFWRCHYHAIWTTYRREPLITAAMEAVIIEAIRRKSRELACPLLAVNGVADHIHVAVSIPPRIAAADWLGQVKGLSAYEINQHFPDRAAPFGWQTGYGLLTFGARNLTYVVAYIENQKTHHAEHTTQPYLEQADDR